MCCHILVDQLSMFQFVCVSVYVRPGKPSGYDRVRNAEIGNKVRGEGAVLPHPPLLW